MDDKLKKSIVMRERKEQKTIRDGLDALESIVGAVKSGKDCFGLTMGAVSLIQIVEALVENLGGGFDFSTAVWSANQVDINRLYNLKNNGGLGRCSFILDPSVYTRKKEVVKCLHETFGAKSVATVSTHAKFVTLQNKSYDLCIMSSMNFTHNPRMEQYQIINDKDVCGMFNSTVEQAFSLSADSGRSDGRRQISSSEMTSIVGNNEYNPLDFVTNIPKGYYSD